MNFQNCVTLLVLSNIQYKNGRLDNKTAVNYLLKFDKKLLDQNEMAAVDLKSRK